MLHKVREFLSWVWKGLVAVFWSKNGRESARNICVVVVLLIVISMKIRGEPDTMLNLYHNPIEAQADLAWAEIHVLMPGEDPAIWRVEDPAELKRLYAVMDSVRYRDGGVYNGTRRAECLYAVYLSVDGLGLGEVAVSPQEALIYRNNRNLYPIISGGEELYALLRELTEQEAS